MSKALTQTFMLSLAFIFAGSTLCIASEKSIAAKDVAPKAVLHAHGYTASKNLQHRIMDALQTPHTAQGYVMAVMSPVNPMRLRVLVRGDVKEVTLVDAKTNGVTRQWTIEPSASPALVSDISQTVLQDMGLAEARPNANKPATAKHKRNLR